MAIASLANVNDAFPGHTLYFSKSTVVATGILVGVDVWRRGDVPAAGATPATGSGETCTSATAGALTLPTPQAGKQLYVAELQVFTSTGTGTATFSLYDRLVQTSGLVGNVTTAQTVNTVSLPRYTDGVGVEIWLTAHTAPSTNTSNTVTVSYTNQAGTSGRTSPSITMSTAFAATSFYRIPLQSGDYGVRSVESVTFSQSFGATVGDIGVTLAHSLARNAIGVTPVRDNWLRNLAPVNSDACLGLAVVSASAASVTYQGQVILIEG